MAQDANYNVTAIFDNSGNVVERYVYDPFGQVTALDTNWNVLAASTFAWLYLHQGGRYDVTNGLYHFRFRDYSPTLGRWTSLDPLSYAAGGWEPLPQVLNVPTFILIRVGRSFHYLSLVASCWPELGSVGWTTRLRRFAVGPRRGGLSLLSHRTNLSCPIDQWKNEVQARYRNDMQVADGIVITARLAEREGFEPSVRGYRTQHFQCCLFNHSSTAPGVLRLFCFAMQLRGRVAVQ